MPRLASASPPCQNWQGGEAGERPKRLARRRIGQVNLTGGFFFLFMRWRVTVIGGLLRISGRFPGHISGIVMVFAFRILAGLLLIWVFVVDHHAFLWGGVTRPTGPMSLSSTSDFRLMLAISRRRFTPTGQQKGPQEVAAGLIAPGVSELFLILVAGARAWAADRRSHSTMAGSGVSLRLSGSARLQSSGPASSGACGSTNAKGQVRRSTAQ
jgi:hypothetical protein